MTEIDLARPSSFNRRLPHSVEAEQAFLGSVMVDNRVFEHVSCWLRSEHFVLADHSTIFDVASRLVASGRVADPVTMKDSADPSYLVKLADCAVTRRSAVEYAKMIKDLSVRRNLIAYGEEVVDLAYAETPCLAADQIILTAGARLESVCERTGTTEDPRHVRTAFDEAFRLAGIAVECREQGRLPGISTGIHDVDELTYGMHRGELTFIAGRPSMGKTALVVNLARNVAAAYRLQPAQGDRPAQQHGGRVIFFSLEMRYHQIAEMIQASASRIGAHRLRGGKLSRTELAEACYAALERFGQMPLHIDDRAGLTVSQIRSTSARLKRRKGLDLIIIDYLQLIGSPPGSDRMNDNSRLEAISRDLKVLAKELDAPVVCLSQLSRAVEQRDDKRPQLSDLRGSGAIEQDADNVAFVYRESYYLERSEPVQRPSETAEKFSNRLADWQRRCEDMRNVIELIYAKQRMGPIRGTKLYCDFALSYVGNLDRTGHDQHRPGGH